MADSGFDNLLKEKKPLTATDLDWSARDAAYKRQTMEQAGATGIGTPPPEGTYENNLVVTRLIDSYVNPDRATYINPDPNLLPEPVLPPEEKELIDKQQIKDLLRDADSIALFAIGDEYQHRFIKDNLIVQDYKKMTPYDFKKRYGTEVYQDLAALQIGGKRIIDYAKSPASGLGETLQDLGTHGLAGGVRLVADVAAFGINKVGGSDSYMGQGFDALSKYFGGPQLSDNVDRLNTALVTEADREAKIIIKENQSETSRKQTIVAGIQDTANKIDQALAYPEDVRKHGQMVADFRLSGSKILDTGKLLLRNPKHWENLTAQVLPSLVATRGITAGVAAPLKAAAASKYLAPISGKIAPAMEGIAFNVAVGIQEGGGSFSSAVIDIVNMSHTELMEKAPEYARMVRAGVLPEDAKTQLAIKAGNTAGNVGFVTGAITAALAPKSFELGKQAEKGLIQTVKNLPGTMAREVIEEVPQSAASQFAANYGKSQVLPDQSLGTNVIEAGVEGGAAAMMAGPLVKSPKLALQTLASPFTLAGYLLTKSADKQAARDAAASPASTANLTRDAQAAQQAAPTVTEGLRTLATEAAPAAPAAASAEAGIPPVYDEQNPPPAPDTTEATPTEEAETVDTPEENETFIKRVEAAATLQNEDMEGLPTHIAEKIGELAAKLGRMPTRFEAMTELAKITEDAKAPENDKVTAAAFVTNIINNNKELFEGELPAFLANTPQTHPARKEFDEYAKILNNMGENPQVKKVMDFLAKAKVPETPDLANVDLASPEGQRVINDTISLATALPEKVNEKTVDFLLQADEKTSKLTPRQRQVLRGQKSMHASQRMFSALNRVPEPGMLEAEGLELEQELEETREADETTIAKTKVQRAASREKAKTAKVSTSAEPADTAPAIGTPDITPDGIDLVSRQIDTEGGARAHQKSIKTHVAEISQAILSGDTKALKKRIRHLAMFAQSQRNKLEAMQQSIDGKGSTDPRSLGRVPYEAFDGKNMRPADGVFEVFFNTKAANSAKAAQQIYAEAATLTKLANDYIEAHPEAGLTPHTGELKLTLPNAATQIIKGSSQTQQTTPTPATTSGTATAAQGELPLSGSVPAAITTTAADTGTSTKPITESAPAPQKTKSGNQLPDKAKSQATSRWTEEQLRGYSPRQLQVRLDAMQKVKDSGRATPQDLATYEAIVAEDKRRKPKTEAAPAQIQAVKPRITHEQAENLTEEQLDETLKRINEKPDDSWTDEDHATFDVLEAEVIRRENDKASKAETQKPVDLDDTLEVDETPHTDIKTAFPNLVHADTTNWFHKAFQFGKKLKSRLSLLAQPLAELKDLLSTNGSVNDFFKKVGIDSYSMKPKDIAAHKALMPVMDSIYKILNDRLANALGVKNAEGKSLLDRIREGDSNTIRTRNNRILNILEVNPDGTYKYNPQLIQASIISAVDWVLNIGDRQVPVDVSDVAKAMSIDESEAGQFLDDFKRGLSREMAVRSLAENVKKFMGVQTNKNTNEDFTKGIPEAIAKELLMTLSELGFIQLAEVKYKIPTVVIDKQTGKEVVKNVTAKRFGRVWFDEQSPDIQKLIRGVDRTHNLYRDLFLVDAEKEGYSIGVPITDVDDTQLRQQMVNTTNQQKEGLFNGQHVGHFLDRLMLNLYTSMDEEGYISLMSGRPYQDGDLEKTHLEMNLNKRDWESIKGRQRGLQTTYRNIKKQVAAMQAHADEKGIDITEVPVYYRHHINRLGRPQMDGASNPQTDKTARHTFLSTRATVDLSVPKSPIFQKFLLTIGQGIGLKTEREFRDDIADKVTAKIFDPNGELHPLLQGLMSWLQMDQANIPEATYKLLQKAQLTDHGLHAMMAAAKYQLALDQQEDLTTFEHYNPLEADGKTNGVINALMMAAGKITAKWLKTVGKGGVFFGRLNKTLNQHMLEDSADIYQVVSDLTSVNMSGLGQRIRNQEDQAPSEQFEALRRLMAALHVEVNFNKDGELELKRGLSKSPQTKSVYGAGANSLAVTVTNELVDVIYEAMSQAIQEGKYVGDILYGQGGARTFLKDLKNLISGVTVHYEKKNTYFVADGSDASRTLSANAHDFELSPEQFSNLKQNVKLFLIEPMQKAIKATVNDHVNEVTEAVQKATQIQSIFLRNMFIQEVIGSMLEKQSDKEANDWHKGEISLSEKDMDRIRKLLKRFSPFIDTGTQRYMMSGGETTNLFDAIDIEVDGKPVTIRLPQGYSRTLDDKLETAIYIYGATYAGVRAIPTLNVGSGDGQMMLNMLADHPEAMKRMLHVFDGLYMPVDKIEEFSRLVNQSVYKTWTGNTNPIRAVADSYEAFIKANPVDHLFPGSVRAKYQDDALYEITKVAANVREPKEKDLLNSGQADAYMRGMVDTLHELADRLDVRRQLYTEFDLSIDQMASGESPFVREGSIKLDPNISMEDLADAMAKRQAELEAKLPSRKTKTPQAAPKPSTAAQKIYSVLDKFVREHALVDPSTGARIVTVEQLRNLPTQTALMTKTIKYLSGNGYRIVFGNSQQLTQWSRANVASDDVLFTNAYGMADLKNKIIYVAEESQDTLAHELIHAATFDKLKYYYENGPARDLLSQEDQAAIIRIESLMEEWLNDRSAVDDEATRTLDMDARAAIVEWKFDGQMAPAVNEFMAYVLSHQELATAAAKIETKSALSRIISQALTAIKTLIWGKNIQAPGTDILSNLRFNTEILLATPTPVQQLKNTAGPTMLFQSPAFGNNDRLTAVREGINRKIISWLQESYTGPMPRGATEVHRRVETFTQQTRRANELDGAKLVAESFVKEFGLHFPDLNTMQGYSTFEMLQSALMTDIKMNPNVMARLEELYDHVISKLNVEDFRTNQNPNDPVDAQRAQDKFDAIHGLKIFHADKYGRSSFMSSFLALAMTSDEFRNILTRMEKPKSETNTAGGLDATIDNLTTSMLDRTSMALSGERADSTNITDALDDLTAKMIEQVADQEKYIDVQVTNKVSAIDKRLAEGIQNVSESVMDKSSQVIASSGSKLVRGGAKLVRAAMTLINEQAAQDAQLGLVGAVSKVEGWDDMRALLNDWVGRTKSNFNVWDLISKVRAIAQQTRQRYRDRLPKVIAKQFSRTLTDVEQTSIYRGLITTDLGALFDTQRADGAFTLLTNTRALNQEVRSLEASIANYEGTRAAQVIQKAKQHAHYMSTGTHGANWLSNSHSISRLYGEREYQARLTNPQLEGDVDRLITLYAMQAMSQEDRTALRELINNENEGMKFVYHYLAGLRKNELAKVGGRYGTPNYIKGHAPSEKLNEGNIIVADDTQHEYYSKLGYARLDDYEGSSADRTLRGKGYYFSPVNAKAPFRQGIMQTVRYTSSGIDPTTGYLSDELTAGRITKQPVVDLIRRQISGQRQTTENLRPVYDLNTGEVVAYERLVDATKLVGLNHSTHAAKMIGAWKGRQVEESFAPALNEELVDELKKTWDKATTPEQKRQFVNVLQTDDPVLKDAVKLIPHYTRDYIESVFGKDTFMVRRDLELQALGDRQASIGDMFTGQTRWKPGVHERFEKLALGLFATAPFRRWLGENKAYPTLVNSEALIAEFVTSAKNNIVVKSVLVPMANIMANFAQLLNRSVPFRTIIQKFPQKVLEINTYIRSRDKVIELEAKLQAARGENDLAEIRKLESRIRATEDSWKNLSIYPLIEGGQFASISQGQVTAEDLALADGRWSKFVERQINKIPDNGLRTLVKYGTVSEDTAMFRILAASVQYGDFVAKAILYDHLVENEAKASKEAVAEVGEAFINYNVLAGRGRDWYERHGLLWFYNYKLRAMKEAAYLIRNRPLTSLFMMFAPGLSSFQSPVDSNFVALAVDGDLPWSIGPGMGLNSWAMNPWVNLAH